MGLGRGDDAQHRGQEEFWGEVSPGHRREVLHNEAPGG